MNRGRGRNEKQLGGKVNHILANAVQEFSMKDSPLSLKLVAASFSEFHFQLNRNKKNM